MNKQLQLDNVAYTFIDFETASAVKTSACQIALIQVKNGKIIKTYNTLIKPYPTTFTNSFIHGITADDVKDAPLFAEIWDEIVPFFAVENIILAHNASFDISVLKALLAFYKLECKNFSYICTVNLFRKTHKYPNNKLETIARVNNIRFKSHDAIADVFTLYKLINLHFSENYHLINICQKNKISVKKLFNTA